jgi:hypothetical protein
MISLSPFSSEVYFSDSTRYITGNEEETLPEARNGFNAVPNPFNPSVQLTIPKQFKNITTVKVFDIKGRQVADLSKNVPSGRVLWNPEKYTASGVFIVRFSSGNTTVKKMKITLVR